MGWHRTRWAWTGRGVRVRRRAAATAWWRRCDGVDVVELPWWRCCDGVDVMELPWWRCCARTGTTWTAASGRCLRPRRDGDASGLASKRSYLVPHRGVPGWACGHARNSQPPLARGKPGIDVAFPLLSFGAHPDCQNHTVPTAPAVRAPARPVGSSANPALVRQLPFCQT